MITKEARRGRFYRTGIQNNAQPAWPPIVIAYGAILLYVISPGRADYPALVISVLTFSLVQLLNRRARLNFDMPLNPLNIAWVLFALQLVVLPLLGIYAGFTRNVLPWLPSERAVNIAILVSTVSYVSFVAGVSLLERSERSRTANTSNGVILLHQGYNLVGLMIISFFILGFIGFLLYFGSFEHYLAYLASPVERYVTVEALGGTLAGAATSFLRPFLVFGIVLAWSYTVDRFRRTSDGRSKTLIVVTLCTALGLLVLNLDFNRAATIGPLLALLAVFSLRVRRLPFSIYIVFGVGILVSAFIWGQYRHASVPFDAWIAGEVASYRATALGPTDQLQVYAAGPQFSGFLLEETGMGSSLYWGKTLLGSLLSPVPILGKEFRAISGVRLYNYLIYGSVGFVDQVIPFYGELFINFHIVGVIIGYSLVGYCVARAQRNYLSSPNTFETYIWFFVAIWLLFLVPGSLAVISQILVFSLLPVYIYFILKHIRVKHRVPGTISHQ